MATAERNIPASVGVSNLNPQKYSKLDPADMISRFPDSFLSHILSFLPTKYAVATSVLSKRWEFLWTKIHSLYFDDKMLSICQRGHQDAGQCMTFPHFVERVMLLRDTTYSMEKFHLNCCCDAYHINTWISSATVAGVRELNLSVYTGEVVQLPQRLFTNNRPVVLKLSGSWILINFQRSCLPCLKTLHLRLVKYQNNAAFKELISSCSVLESLFVRLSRSDNVNEFDISSRTLKCLAANFHYCFTSEFRQYSGVLKLDTPRLQFLKISGDGFQFSLRFKELPSLHEANFCALRGPILRSFLHNLRSLYNLKVLSLSIRSPFFDSVLFSRFCKLTSLKLEASVCMWEHLRHTLNGADNLEALTYQERSPCSIPLHQQIRKWSTKPRLSRLSSVSIIGFHGGLCDLGFVRYILENAKVLTKMEIRCSSETSAEEKFRLLQKVAEMPRISPTVNSHFHEASYGTSCLHYMFLFNFVIELCSY